MDSTLNSKPLVSISCLTFNHVNFIEKALNGFLMQKTNFKFEVLIHDDASTDGTEEIVRDFERRYPFIIKALYEETNQWVKGRKGSAVFNFPRAKGKYIALCEGDDYWTDPLKLQKQVDFMEANLDYSMCFHEAEIVDLNGKLISLFNNEIKNKTYTLKDFTVKNFVATASSVFRNKIEFPEKFNELPACDWAIHMLNAEMGKIYYMPEVMSAYRIHDGGAWSKLNHNEMILKGVEVMKKLDSFFEYKHHDAFKKGINERLLRLKKNKKPKTIKKKLIGILKNSINYFKTNYKILD